MARQNEDLRMVVFDLDGVIFKDDSFFEQMYDKYDQWAPKKKILEICEKYLKTDTAKAAELAGLSIAFNSDCEELRKKADVVIDKKDLREILKHI